MQASAEGAIWFGMRIMRFVFLALLVNTAVADGVSFERQYIRLGDHVLEVEIADDAPKREHGLMERTSLEEGQGMLFVYRRSAPRVFWMHRTYIALSIAIFDSERKLIAVEKMTPADLAKQSRYSVFTSPAETRYALELRQGWFEENQIALGATFDFLGTVIASSNANAASSAAEAGGSQAVTLMPEARSNPVVAHDEFFEH